MSIKRLPNWVITSKNPAFYDTESKSVLEQTAKLYTVVGDLVDAYNLFEEDVVKMINDLRADTNGDFNVFKMTVEQKFSDFKEVIEEKITSQDATIKDMLFFIENNLESYIKNSTSEELLKLFESGALDEEFNKFFIELEKKATETVYIELEEETPFGETQELASSYNGELASNPLFISNVEKILLYEKLCKFVVHSKGSGDSYTLEVLDKTTENVLTFALTYIEKAIGTPKYVGTFEVHYEISNGEVSIQTIMGYHLNELATKYYVDNLFANGSGGGTGGSVDDEEGTTGGGSQEIISLAYESNFLGSQYVSDGVLVTSLGSEITKILANPSKYVLKLDKAGTPSILLTYTGGTTNLYFQGITPAYESGTYKSYTCQLNIVTTDGSVTSVSLSSKEFNASDYATQSYVDSSLASASAIETITISGFGIGSPFSSDSGTLNSNWINKFKARFEDIKRGILKGNPPIIVIASNSTDYCYVLFPRMNNEDTALGNLEYLGIRTGSFTTIQRIIMTISLTKSGEEITGINTITYTRKNYEYADKLTTVTGYDASKTQVLKNVNGTLTWVDE